MAETIQPGSSLLVHNAMGEWLEAIAVTAPEGTHSHGKRIHDFPIVWVKFTTRGPAFPWPLEDVRLAEDTHA